MKIRQLWNRGRPNKSVGTASKILIGAFLVTAIVPTMSYAHSNGPRSYTWDPSWPTFSRRSCARAQSDMRRSASCR